MNEFLFIFSLWIVCLHDFVANVLKFIILSHWIRDRARFCLLACLMSKKKHVRKICVEQKKIKRTKKKLSKKTDKAEHIERTRTQSIAATHTLWIKN